MSAQVCFCHLEQIAFEKKERGLGPRRSAKNHFTDRHLADTTFLSSTHLSLRHWLTVVWSIGIFVLLNEGKMSVGHVFFGPKGIEPDRVKG
jgi:hypothetical protein